MVLYYYLNILKSSWVKKKLDLKLFLMVYKKYFLGNLKKKKSIRNLKFYMFQSMKNIKIN